MEEEQLVEQLIKILREAAELLGASLEDSSELSTRRKDTYALYLKDIQSALAFFVERRDTISFNKNR